MEFSTLLSVFFCVASAQFAAWPATSYSPYYQALFGPARTPVLSYPTATVAESAIPVPAAAPVAAAYGAPVAAAYAAPAYAAPVAAAPVAAAYAAPVAAPAPYAAAPIAAAVPGKMSLSKNFSYFSLRCSRSSCPSP